MIEINEFDMQQKVAESTKLIRNIFDNNFTKRQLDMVYAIISLVKPTDDDFKTYHISYSAIGKIFNPQNPYCEVTVNDINLAVKDIMNKSFRIKTDKKHYHYIEYAEVDEEERYIDFKLSEDVKQFYLKLRKEEYAVFLLNDIVKLSTVFQLNLFKWLSCNSNFKNDVSIYIEDAKLRFYGDASIRTADFTRKLDSAIKQINKKTNLDLSYQRVNKRGSRKIAVLRFTIKNKYKSEK